MPLPFNLSLDSRLLFRILELVWIVNVKVCINGKGK